MKRVNFALFYGSLRTFLAKLREVTTQGAHALNALTPPWQPTETLFTSDDGMIANQPLA